MNKAVTYNQASSMWTLIQMINKAEMCDVYCVSFVSIYSDQYILLVIMQCIIMIIYYVIIIISGIELYNCMFLTESIYVFL